MQLIKRSLSVLRAVSEQPRGMTLQELSTALQIPAPTMHRLVGALASERFLVRSNATKRYLIGPDALRLASCVRPVADACADVLTALADASGETSFVTELVGDRAVCVALVESPRPLRLFVNVGQELPLHAAASTRAILAFLEGEHAEELLKRSDLISFTSETPTTVAETLDHLRVVRKRGYDVCEEELDPGVCAVGAPVRNSVGAVVASVTVAGPSGRLTPSIQSDLVDQVVAAGVAISERLGYRAELPLERSASST